MDSTYLFSPVPTSVSDEGATGDFLRYRWGSNVFKSNISSQTESCEMPVNRTQWRDPEAPKSLLLTRTGTLSSCQAKSSIHVQGKDGFLELGLQSGHSLNLLHVLRSDLWSS